MVTIPKFDARVHQNGRGWPNRILGLRSRNKLESHGLRREPSQGKGLRCRDAFDAQGASSDCSRQLVLATVGEEFGFVHVADFILKFFQLRIVHRHDPDTRVVYFAGWYGNILEPTLALPGDR